jgi:hypothetical protein
VAQVGPDNQPYSTAIPYTQAGVEIDFATEAKLEACRVLLAALDAKDFATQATLDAFLTAFGSEDFASQTTLAALLAAFDAEDFSSETTLAALKAAFDAEDFASQTTLAALLAAFDAEDFASETTLAAFGAAFVGTDFSTETTLAALKAAFDAEDFASETTLLAADGRLTTIDAVLDSIKDVDGIKKITDPILIGPGSELIGTVKVRGSDGLHDANVDSSHRLSVTGALVIPDGFVDKSRVVQGLVLGNAASDTDYIVTDGETLTLSQFFGGGEVQSGKQSKFELYHSVDGGTTDGLLLGVGYIGGSNNFRQDLNHDIVGSGVLSVVRIRRERMDGVSLELAAGWIGIETV